MNPSINHVTLSGRVAFIGPERETSSGTVCTVGVETGTRGPRGECPTLINVTVWRPLDATVLAVGDDIVVEGYLKSRRGRSGAGKSFMSIDVVATKLIGFGAVEDDKDGDDFDGDDAAASGVTT